MTEAKEAKRNRRMAEASDSSGAPSSPDAAESAVETGSKRIAHGGEWMPAEELRAWALPRLESGGAFPVFDMSEASYLDARMLQTLLAIDARLRERGQQLCVAHASAELEQWFGYAGAAEWLAGHRQAEAA